MTYRVIVRIDLIELVDLVGQGDGKFDSGKGLGMGAKASMVARG